MNKSQSQFRTQKSEIYNASQKSSQRVAKKLVGNEDDEAIQISNLKQVLNAKNQIRKSGLMSSHKTFSGVRNSADFSNAATSFDDYQLPEHAA